jgi:hypothetical protein
VEEPRTSESIQIKTVGEGTPRDILTAAEDSCDGETMETDTNSAVTKADEMER